MNLENLYKRLEKIKTYDEDSRILKENLLKEIQAEMDIINGKDQNQSCESGKRNAYELFQTKRST